MANILTSNLEIAAIIVDVGVARPVTRRVVGMIRKYGFWGFIDRCALAILKVVLRDRSVRRRELERVFGEENCAAFSKPDLVVPVRGVNSKDTLKVLSDTSPDLLLVYGTGIVGSKVRALAGKRTLNMHTGLSPYYRGASCAFWPIYNRELERLGATVHECTEQVDGGVIYGVTTLQLEREDKLHAVFARAVVAGAALYVDVVGSMDQGLENVINQDLSIGREYRASMRGIRAEFLTRLIIRMGLVRNFVDRMHIAACRKGDDL